MLRKALTRRGLVPVLMCFQIIPLMIFPPSSYSLRSQEWWLPLLLAVLAIIALVQILVRKTLIQWPWYLLSFGQGFNIISRLLMLMPHSTEYVNNVQVANTSYLLIAVISMLLSAFEIWYMDLPEVKNAVAGPSGEERTA
jgi:hypothetical protein